MVRSKEEEYKGNPFCVSPHKLFLKYDQQICHWVGHYLVRPINTDESKINK